MAKRTTYNPDGTATKQTTDSAGNVMSTDGQFAGYNTREELKAAQAKVQADASQNALNTKGALSDDTKAMLTAKADFANTGTTKDSSGKYKQTMIEGTDALRRTKQQVQDLQTQEVASTPEVQDLSKSEKVQSDYAKVLADYGGDINKFYQSNEFKGLTNADKVKARAVISNIQSQAPITEQRQNEIINNLNTYTQTNPDMFKDYSTFQKNFGTINGQKRNATEQAIIDNWYKSYESQKNVLAKTATISSGKELYTKQQAGDVTGSDIATIKATNPVLGAEYDNYKKVEDIRASANGTSPVTTTTVAPAISTTDSFSSMNDMFMKTTGKTLGEAMGSNLTSYRDEYNRVMNTAEINGLSAEVNRLTGEKDTLNLEKTNIREYIRKKYPSLTGGAFEGAVADREKELNDKLNTVNIALNTASNTYNDKIQNAQTELKLIQQDNAEKQQLFQTQLSMVKMSYDIFANEQARQDKFTLFQMQQEANEQASDKARERTVEQIKLNKEASLETYKGQLQLADLYTNGDINSEDQTLVKKAVDNAVKEKMDLYTAQGWSAWKRGKDEISSAIQEGLLTGKYGSLSDGLKAEITDNVQANPLYQSVIEQKTNPTLQVGNSLIKYNATTGKYDTVFRTDKEVTYDFKTTEDGTIYKFGSDGTVSLLGAEDLMFNDTQGSGSSYTSVDFGNNTGLNKGDYAPEGTWFSKVGSGLITQIGGSNDTGIDIDGKIGDPIPSPVDGTILSMRTATSGKYKGNIQLEIKGTDGMIYQFNHLNGYGGIDTGGMSRELKVGDTVSKGQKVAFMGNTGYVIAGKGGDGSHLDFVVKDSNGNAISANKVARYVSGIYDNSKKEDSSDIMSVSQASDIALNNNSALTNAIAGSMKVSTKTVGEQAERIFLDSQKNIALNNGLNADDNFMKTSFISTAKGKYLDGKGTRQDWLTDFYANGQNKIGQFYSYYNSLEGLKASGKNYIKDFNDSDLSVARTQAEALRMSLKNEIGLGVLSASDYELLDKLVGTPESVRATLGNKGIEYIQVGIHEMLKKTYNGYNSKLNTFGLSISANNPMTIQLNSTVKGDSNLGKRLNKSWTNTNSTGSLFDEMN